MRGETFFLPYMMQYWIVEQVVSYIDCFAILIAFEQRIGSSSGPSYPFHWTYTVSTVLLKSLDGAVNADNAPEPTRSVLRSGFAKQIQISGPGRVGTTFFCNIQACYPRTLSIWCFTSTHRTLPAPFRFVTYARLTLVDGATKCINVKSLYKRRFLLCVISFSRVSISCIHIPRLAQYSQLFRGE